MKKIVELFFLSVVVLIGCGFSAKLTVEVDNANAAEDAPVVAMATVTYSAKEKINPKSFVLNGSSLQAVFEKEQQHMAVSLVNGVFEEESVVSAKYHFELPPRPAGRYTLPSVSVDVGDERTFSRPISYEVYGVESSKDFLLKAGGRGLDSLFPGKEVEFFYRIYYKKSIEPMRESLPLLEESDGFRHVGERIITNSEENGYQVQEISQRMQALIPSNNTFGPSYIDGMLYSEDSAGKRSYQPPKLRAEAIAVEVKVSPFPTKGKPKSFNGALGRFEYSVDLVSDGMLRVGDIAKLKITVRGDEKALENYLLPDLATQISLGKKEKLLGVPTLMPGKKQKGMREYLVDMRVLSHETKEVPSLEFSSFDFETEEYLLFHTQPRPFALETEAPKKIEEKKAQEPPKIELFLVEKEEEKLRLSVNQKKDLLHSPFELSGNYLLLAEQLRPAHTERFLAFLPVGVGLLFVQGELHRAVTRKKKGAKQRSRRLFREAKKAANELPTMLSLLEQCLMVRLKEKGHLLWDASCLRDGGGESCLRVVSFFQDIERRRYAPHVQGVDAKELLDEARKLYRTL
ncbi:BatD family protein [Simkania negevensis]|uniref:BatD family protein n=1 Tax=Simkania negevensis TaxID=83561 RepID=A0ABS3ATL8_9BACT|nr:BatD family protein [Simkania negevensis]